MLFRRRHKEPEPALLAARDAYELWAPGYPPIAHNPLMRAEQGAVEDALRSLALTPRRALDIGTGSGRYLPILAAAGAAQVVGIDFSKAMLAQAQTSPSPRLDASRRSQLGQASRLSQISRICGDARRLPFQLASFDLINASLMAGDIDDLASFVSNVAAVLAPGGHFIYSDFHPTWTAQGWRRTFRTAGGQQIALAYTPRGVDDHLAALRDAGLRLAAMREPRLDPQERAADVDGFRRQWGDPPVVIVLHATKDAAP